MSRKKEREWKQQLIEALNAEAEEIEKRARSCQAELSEEKKTGNVPEYYGTHSGGGQP